MGFTKDVHTLLAFCIGAWVVLCTQMWGLPMLYASKLCARTVQWWDFGQSCWSKRAM